MCKSNTLYQNKWYLAITRSWNTNPSYATLVCTSGCLTNLLLLISVRFIENFIDTLYKMNRDWFWKC